MAGAIACRFALMAFDVPNRAIYMFTAARVDSLSMGAVIALLRYSPDAWRRLCSASRIMFPVLLCAGVVWVMMRDGSPWRAKVVLFGYTIVALLFASAVVLTLDTRPDWLRNQTLANIGKYSYAMYIFHLPLRSEFIRFFTFPSLPEVARGIVVVALSSLATYALAAFSWHVYEKHFLRLKQRF